MVKKSYCNDQEGFTRTYEALNGFKRVDMGPECSTSVHSFVERFCMVYKMFYRVRHGLERVYKCLLSYKRMTNPKVIKTPLIIPSSSQQNHGKAEGASHPPHLQGEQRRSPRSDRPPSQPRFRNSLPNALPEGQVSLLADAHSGRCLRHRDGRLRS
jgi:hypothetical protein